MFQELAFGSHFWEEISEKDLREKLAKRYQPDEFPRILASLARGDTEQTLYGFVRWRPPEKPGIPWM